MVAWLWEVKMKRVVITGMGIVSPFGNDYQDVFKKILDKQCAVSLISHFDHSKYRVKVAAPITNFDFSAYFDEHELRFNDRYTQFAKVASKIAYKQSRLSESSLAKERLGVIYGAGIGGIASMEKAKENLDQKGPTRVFPHFIVMSIVNAAAGNVAIDCQAKGICLPVVSGCAAGTDAIGQGYLTIKHGQLDAVVVGASEASLTPLGVSGFMAMKALYEGDDINRASIPFDKDRAGFVMSEGAGSLILEDYDHAVQRNAPILGEIVGYGSTCDAYHMTAPSENGDGIKRAMEMACTDANIHLSEIDYINAHGTSTPLNDPIEANAIASLFHHNVAISSTKSHLGHALGASGAIEAIISLCVLEHQIIPGTISTKQLDEKIKGNILLDNKKQTVNYVLSNSLGFGGHNASIIFKRWTSDETI